MPVTAPLAPVTPPAPPVPVHVAVARFVVRSLCDSTGQPDTVLIVMYPWLAFAAAFFWAALKAPAAVIDANVSSMAVTAVQLITLALILWAAALKLGEGVFVPLATAIAGAFRAVGSAAGAVLTRARDYGGGPDRRVGLTDPGGELHRDAGAPVEGGDPIPAADVLDPPPMGDPPGKVDPA